MALVNDIADQLVALLGTADFLPDADIRRSYIPTLKPDQITKLTIDVIPPAISTGRNSTREAVSYRPKFFICLMNNIDQANEVPTTDALIDLVHELFVFLYKHQSLSPTAAIAAVDFEQLFDPTHLQNGVFQSALSVEVQSFLTI